MLAGDDTENGGDGAADENIFVSMQTMCATGVLPCEMRQPAACLLAEVRFHELSLHQNLLQPCATVERHARDHPQVEGMSNTESQGMSKTHNLL